MSEPTSTGGAAAADPARRDKLPDEAVGRAPGRGRLAGRRIVVVGAGTRPSHDPDQPVGNGRAIAVLAAREGAAVACVDIDPDAAETTAELIRAEGGTAVTIIADVVDADACERLMAESVEALGGVDGVVVNVGIARGSRISGTTATDWDATFAVNLRAHFLVAKATLERASRVAPEASDAGVGPTASIVFISSVAGLRAGSRIPAYDASKAGILGLARQVAAEGGRRGLRANTVVPGLIDTPLGRVASGGRPSRASTPVTLGRQGTAWEVAYATIFLLSDEASYITGQTLIVDGGLAPS
jgi:NAD(P)-dependent dehydrogenase (short-subunit alcohol dehydrogenase family)